MDYHWTYIGCDVEDERAIARRWEELQLGLEGQLAALENGADDATFIATYDSDSDPSWEIQAVVTSPAAAISADARADEPYAALDEVVQQLAGQIGELDSQPQDGKPLRRQLGAIVPYLERARQEERMQAFAALLLPILDSLRAYAVRELNIREIEGNLLEGEWVIDDLVDETLLRAWENFERRPRSVPLDAWLVGIIGQVLETATDQEALRVPLGEARMRVKSTPPDIASGVDEWVEQPDELQQLDLPDLLPAESIPDVWENIEPEHRENGLYRLLGDLSHDERQALLLATLHGLEHAEIADVLGISVENAQATLDSARNRLWRSMNHEDFWQRVQDSADRRKRRRRSPA